jgi:hypothetical protein
MSWLSKAVKSPLHWDIDRLDFIRNINYLGNMLVLDVLLLNGDRHGGNILLQPNPDELDLHLWTIDADDVLAPIRAPGIPYADIRGRAIQIADRATALSRACL